MIKITTLQNVKDDLGINDNSMDALLTRYIESVEQAIINYIGYEPQLASVAETFDIFDVNDRQVIYPAKRPINTITSIVLNGLSLTSEQYYKYSDHIVLKTWQHGHQVLTISYSGGYATIPADLESVARELAIAKYLNRGSNVTNGPVRSESIGSWSRTFADSSSANNTRDGFLTVEHKDILDKYKVIVL